MVRVRSVRAIHTGVAAVLILSAALLAGCSLFAAHPFPDYIAGIEKRVNISERIAAALKTAVSARYEIGNIATPAGDRVLLLIDPAVAEPNPDSPTPLLLIFNRTLDYLGSVVPQGPLGYFGRPFALAADGNVLSGDTVFDPATDTVVLTLSPTGLTGFGFSVTSGTPATYILSLPPGETASTQLVLSSYDNIWSAPVNYNVDILPAGTTGGSTYVLEGARLESDNDTVTITMRDAATDVLTVVHASLAAVIAGTAPALISAGSGAATMDGSDSKVYYTANDIVLRRTTGSFERYTSDGTSMTAKITSDRRTGIVYGFSPDGAYLYRLDPATGSFALIRTWW